MKCLRGSFRLAVLMSVAAMMPLVAAGGRSNRLLKNDG